MLLVQITAVPATDLITLTQALDDPELDIADTLRQVAVDVKLAIRRSWG